MLGMILALCCTPLAGVRSRGGACVLILNGSDPYLPAYLAIDSAMRASLANETARRIVLFSESLDAQRFPVEALEPEYLALLTKKYSALRIDVVVTVTQPALEFFKRHGERLWPAARVVYEGFVGEDVGSAGAASKRHRRRGVTGRARDDRCRPAHAARRASHRGDRACRTWTNDTSDWRDRCSRQQPTRCPWSSSPACPCQTLSPGWLRCRRTRSSSISHSFATEPADLYTPREVLRAVSTASAAPVYGVAETYLGFGVAAGSVESYGGQRPAGCRAGARGPGRRPRGSELASC